MPFQPRPTTREGMEELYVRREQRKMSRIRYVIRADFKYFIRSITPAAISDDAVKLVDELVRDAFETIGYEAHHYMAQQGTRMMLPRDVEHGVKVMLPGNMAARLMVKGNSATKVFEKAVK